MQFAGPAWVTADGAARPAGPRLPPRRDAGRRGALGHRLRGLPAQPRRHREGGRPASLPGGDPGRRRGGRGVHRGPDGRRLAGTAAPGEGLRASRDTPPWPRSPGGDSPTSHSWAGPGAPSACARLGRGEDVDFVLDHVDDLDVVCAYAHGELRAALRPAPRAAAVGWAARRTGPGSRILGAYDRSADATRTPAKSSRTRMREMRRLLEAPLRRPWLVLIPLVVCLARGGGGQPLPGAPVPLVHPHPGRAGPHAERLRAPDDHREDRPASADPAPGGARAAPAWRGGQGARSLRVDREGAHHPHHREDAERR